MTEEHKCPTHGTAMDTKGEGIFWCRSSGCKEFIVTPTGARNLHEELCRRHGMTADQIIADWNARSPANDQW